MNPKRLRAHLTVTVVASVAVTTCLVPVSANAVVSPWKNCTQVNKKYPHGVGKVGARDQTAGIPVTSFKRSNSLYAAAMRANRGLDRDKDGIACEKA